MGDKKLLSISIIMLAISIVFGAVWIGKSLDKMTNIKSSNSFALVDKALLTDKESAEYLNITLEEFNDILLKDSKQKAYLNNYPTYKFIPFVQISNNKKMFNKRELDEWVKFNSLNK